MSAGNQDANGKSGSDTQSDFGNHVPTPGDSYNPAPGEIVIDPTSIGRDSGNGDSGNGNDQPKRKRGRPAGSGRKPNTATGKASAVNLEASGVASILLSVHEMLAVLTRVPELSLDKDDADRLAVAATNVGRHYNIEAAQKTIDWTNLSMCVAQIYGAKLLLYRMNKAAKSAPKQSASDPIIDFNMMRNAVKPHNGDIQ